MQIILLTTCFYYTSACVWSRCLPIVMLLLNRWLLFIIKLKLVHKYFDSKSYWFYIKIKQIFFSIQFTSSIFAYTRLKKAPEICCIITKGKGKTSMNELEKNKDTSFLSQVKILEQVHKYKNNGLNFLRNTMYMHKISIIKL